jgi:hypothetical protein
MKKLALQLLSENFISRFSSALWVYCSKQKDANVDPHNNCLNKTTEIRNDSDRRRYNQFSK